MHTHLIGLVAEVEAELDTRDEAEPKPDKNSSRINALSAFYPL
jgi:hypothetical protein